MKNRFRKSAVAVLAVVALAGCSNDAQGKGAKEIELFKMYNDSKGTYLLDPEAEHENVILVEKEQAAEWKLDELHHGTKVTGIFDEEGWELLEIKE